MPFGVAFFKIFFTTHIFKGVNNYSVDSKTYGPFLLVHLFITETSSRVQVMEVQSLCDMHT